MSATFLVKNPFDESEIGEVPVQSAQDVDRAVGLARQATIKNPLPPWQRAEILAACSDLIGQRTEELARIIAKESAKPIATARKEVLRSLSTLEFSSIEARKLAGEIVPLEGSAVGEGKLAFTINNPVGIVGAISPFNFPLNLVCHKVGPALAAGCPVILKPASQTPFSALALAEIFTECGLPPGWLNVVTGSGSEVGNAIVDHPNISYISFTGSSEVGWAIPARAPRKRVGLELGNSTPVIIDSDANWETAASSIAAAAYAHAGQSCVSVQRIYVQSEIASAFTELLVDLVSRLKVGDPLEESTDLSALINTKSRDRIYNWIQQAVAQGATLLCGGEIEGNAITPAVLTNTNLNMLVCKEEAFGPLVAIQTYDTLDEAIHYANGTKYGLQAGIFTQDISNALKSTRELEFGGVLINEVPTWRADVMPYGGVKDSGNTREGPAYAIKQMTESRLVVINL